MVAIPQPSTPWDTNGVQLDIDAGEKTGRILEKAGLNWRVAKRAIYLQDGTVVPEKYAMVKVDQFGTETPLGAVVGKRYEPLQNFETMQMLNKAVADVGGTFESAGTFKDGRVVWAQVSIGDNIRIQGDDFVKRNLTVLNSHDGSISLSMMMTPLRIFCMNMLAQLKENSMMRTTFRHTLSAVERMEEAADQLLEGSRLIAKSAQLFQYLAQQVITVEKLKMFIRAMFPDAETEKGQTVAENSRDQVESIYERGRGTDDTPHTFWRAWNAMVEWADYYRGRDEDSRMMSALLSAGAKFKERALDTAVKIIDGVFVPAPLSTVAQQRLVDLEGNNLIGESEEDDVI